MKRPSRLSENLEVLEISFTAKELAELDRAFGQGGIVGDRYPAFVQKFAAK